MDLQEQLFKAIEVVIEGKLKSFPTDSYIECTIESEIQEENGSYKIKYRDAILEAFPISNSLYSKDDIVYVMAIGGDLSKKKIILTAKSKSGSQYVDLEKVGGGGGTDILGRNYVLESEQAAEFTLKGTEEQSITVSNDFVLDSAAKDTSPAKGNIHIAFVVESHLSPTIDGNYGLAVSLRHTDGSIKEYALTLNEIVGNPFQAIGYQDTVERLNVGGSISAILSAKLFINGFTSEETVKFSKIRVGFLDEAIANRETTDEEVIKVVDDEYVDEDPNTGDKVWNKSVYAEKIVAGKIALTEGMSLETEDASVKISKDGIEITDGKLVVNDVNGNGVILNAFGIDTNFIKYFKNMVQNSQFEIYDYDTGLVRFWLGGTVSKESSFFGTVSLMLNPGETTETTGYVINPQTYALTNLNCDKTRVSFYHIGGSIKVEVIDEFGQNYMLEKTIGEVEQNSLVYSQQSGWLNARKTFSFTHGNRNSITLKFTNMDYAQPVFLDAVQLEPDVTGMWPSFYTDGPESMGDGNGNYLGSDASLSDLKIRDGGMDTVYSDGVSYNWSFDKDSLGRIVGVNNNTLGESTAIDWSEMIGATELTGLNFYVNGFKASYGEEDCAYRWTKDTSGRIKTLTSLASGIVVNIDWNGGEL